jgi:hypothetical protein
MDAKEEHGASPSPTLRRWGRIVLMLGVVLIGMGAAAAYFSYRAGQEAIAASNRFHALICMCDVVVKAVEQSPEKKWPLGWEELERVPAKDFGSFAWPRDAEKMKALLEIDFGATVENVLKQTPQSFSAIRMREGSFQFPAEAINEDFLGRLKRARGG